jgi:hypothetical protein
MCELKWLKRLAAGIDRQLPEPLQAAQQQQQQCRTEEHLQLASTGLTADPGPPGSTAADASCASSSVIIDNWQAAAGCPELTDMAIVSAARLALKLYLCYQDASRSNSSSGSVARSSGNGRRASNQQQQSAAALRAVGEQLLLSIGVSISPETLLQLKVDAGT